MAVTVRNYSDAKVMPWLGGGGSTHELVRFPKSREPFGWRLSVALVESDGRFSSLPGVDRILVFCEGHSMTLSPAAIGPLQRWVPVRFAGEENVACTLGGGPTRDFNVMTRRDEFDADVEVVEIVGGASRVVSSVASHTTVIVVLDGSFECVDPHGRVTVLEQFDSVTVGAPASATLRGDGRAALVVLTSREPTDVQSRNREGI